MKLLVTGAAGMLGRDLMLAAGNAGHDVVGFGHRELDVSDAAAVAKKLDLERPDMVINSAAWTAVDDAEERESDAFAVNGTGAGNVAAAAAEQGAAVVYVSTDYVFDGSKGEPYVESDQPAPLSAYGRTKLAGEEATAAANKRHFIVRSAGLFGIGGRNFVETMLRLAQTQNEVTVVRDQVGSPTYTWHLAYGIVRLIEGIEYGIHHMAAAGKCSWYEFAREIFEQAKVECNVLSITTAEFGAAAPRPAFSALTSQREHAIRLPSWHDGLAGYLAQREEAAA
jgi:dTDP-4-dehydrorhamnose reductase